jgi:hypothetical protein
MERLFNREIGSSLAFYPSSPHNFKCGWRISEKKLILPAPVKRAEQYKDLSFICSTIESEEYSQIELQFLLHMITTSRWFFYIVTIICALPA